MIFDQPPAKLPVATLVPRESGTQVVADLRAWFVARWRWFRPRTIPMIVAFIGMLAVMGSANYLRNYARQSPERLVHVPALEVGSVTGAAGADGIVIVGGPAPRSQSAPTCGHGSP
ncbi:MAG: hypothetical protein H0X17_06515 [Deltaproteobacteria bacterium]|nr:hypothetical protein [Deltaproteobacteria bacterium]